MAEEEEDSAVIEGNEPVAVAIIGSGPSPKNGLVVGTGKAADLLQMEAERALEEHFIDIVKCIITNIKANHLPSVKLLFDMAARAKTEQDIPAEDYQSLAEVLWAALKGQDAAGE